MAMDAEKGADPIGRLMRIAGWGGAAVLFLLPAVAMQLTGEVDWTASDFITWGVMLLAACGAFELSIRMSRNLAYRAGAVIAIGAAFLLVWISLAVGIIGDEDYWPNLMYGGVLAIGILGAAVSRLRPSGMALTTAAMAAVMVLIAVIAVAAGWGAGGGNWPHVVILANGFFAVAWLVSAALFRVAARERTPASRAP